MASPFDPLYCGRRRFLRQAAITLGGLSLLDVSTTRLAGLLLSPPVDPSTDIKAASPRYLDAAPVGIDARWAWTQPNGAGETVGFVDIEMGWFLGFDTATAAQQHEDLPRVGDGLRVSPGVPRTPRTGTCSQSQHHGTAVVGIVTGRDNTIGIVGAAPAAWTEVASHIDNGVPGRVDKAIDAVLPLMSAGDVLLIEWQEQMNWPAEINTDTFGRITAAIAQGVVVIEPAGNGNIPLGSRNSLNPSHQAFEDSGAIIVGACNTPDAQGNGRTRWIADASDFPPANTYPPFLPNCNPPGLPSVFPGSNHGERVDCYAWGRGIVSAGYGWDGGASGTDSYTNRFSGTSGAAAIVAAAAVLIQGLYKHVQNRPLTPAEMRTVLKANGTPAQLTDPAETIGVMPDIRRVAAALGLNPAGSTPSVPTNLRIAQ